MTDKTPAKTTPRKGRPTPVAPQNEPAPPPVEQAELTADDYDVDVNAVLEVLGVPPGMVAANSAHLAFLDGKLIIEYTVQRAVPPRIMGLALLRGAPQPGEGQ